MQKEVIQAALKGEDVFLQAATSFGKSICFQLPAVINSGITIVISPLLALMSNQVNALKEAGIKVESLDSNTPEETKKEIRKDLRCGHPRIKLLYVTPEHCQLDYFRKLLRNVYEHNELARIAIDEAHCISEWGHDFRPAFLGLSFFREELPDVPIICCTATATAEVRQDVIETLNLNPMKLRIFSMSSARPNLHFEVRYQSHDDNPYQDFLDWIRGIYMRREAQGRAMQLKAKQEEICNVSGIIYISSRIACEELAARLTKDGISAKPYHAKLTAENKNKHLQGWVTNKPGYDVICATTAFGMGIDKDDVRFVVHWGLSKSFEGFYQEAGRAGRDGKAAACVLYYNRRDRDRIRTLMVRDIQTMQDSKRPTKVSALANMESRAKSYEALVAYAENTGVCRHELISKYFGDNTTFKCDWACDWHKNPQQLKRDKAEILDDEEWCQTQIAQGAYDEMTVD
jgi:RecQ family ATP-dependent DNA helicase